MGQSRLLVLIFACGITSAAASHKRGIAKANLQEHQLHALKQGVSWGYNWELNPRMQWNRAHMDFFPMVHNNNFPRNAGGGQFRALLGFNEPDIHHQAAMNPWHAAAIWPEVERVARNYGVQTLVSVPAANDAIFEDLNQYESIIYLIYQLYFNYILQGISMYLHYG